MKKIMAVLAACILAFSVQSCTGDDSVSVDVDFTDDFSSDPGNWTLNEDWTFYNFVTVDINVSNAGKLTMSGHPNTTNYSGTYTGMVGMVYSNAAIADTLWTYQVDAAFVSPPTTTDTSKQPQIMVFFNVISTGTFDTLQIHTDGTYDIKSYKSLVELSSSDYSDYAPITGGTIPAGCNFDVDGVNTIKITQYAKIIEVTINGYPVTTPSTWPYAGYNTDVYFGLGFKYGSGLPSTLDGSVEGTSVTFDNVSIQER